MRITNQRINRVIREELDRARRLREGSHTAAKEDMAMEMETEMDEGMGDDGDDDMDDDMGGDMDDDMGGDEVDEDELIDLSLFDDVDSDAAGAAFVEAVSQLRSENSDMQVTSAEIVARMRALLTPDDGDGPMDTGAMSESRWSRLAGILKS